MFGSAWTVGDAEAECSPWGQGDIVRGLNGLRPGTQGLRLSDSGEGTAVSEWTGVASDIGGRSCCKSGRAGTVGGAIFRIGPATIPTELVPLLSTIGVHCVSWAGVSV